MKSKWYLPSLPIVFVKPFPSNFNLTRISMVYTYEKNIVFPKRPKFPCLDVQLFDLLFPLPLQANLATTFSGSKRL